MSATIPPGEVAVIFHRLGPYHCARLNALARTCPARAIELFAETSVYAWDKVNDGVNFPRTTLLLGDARQSGASALQSRLWSELDCSRPAAAAVPGWSRGGALGALRWCAARKVPAVVMSDSTKHDERRVWWKEWIKRRVVRLCAAALVGGRSHADYMAELGMPRDRIFLGYDAVDNDYFSKGAEQSRKQKAESRNKYGLPENYFLVSARFIPEKNLPALLKAYAAYRSKAEMLKEWEGGKVGRCESGKGQGENAETLKAEMLKGDREGEQGSGKVGRCEGAKVEEVNAETLSQETKDHGPKTMDNRTIRLSDCPTTGEAETLKAEMLKREDKPPASSLQPRACTPWHLVLLGDGPLRAELCRLISDLGLQDSVLLPGFKQYPDLPAYYGLANAFILPSVSETWGLVVNEAMASGLPVLVSNRCGCAPDLVQEGVNGWTFDPCNTDQLADLMLRLSQAPKQRLEEMGAASRRIIQDWGVERFATGLKAAVDKALEVGPKRASVFDRLLLRLLMMRGGG